VAVTLINDFEPYGLNNRGDVLYAADLSGLDNPEPGLPAEGLFLRNSNGQVTRLAIATQPAPGGGTFGIGALQGALNDQGDVAFTFLLSPFTLPFGVNAGTFRYSHSTGTVTPVALPFVTPAPGGGVFQGSAFFPNINNRGDLLFDGIVPTDQGIHVPGEDYIGLGQGIFMADRAGRITSVVRPGDAAPGGGTFDFAGQPRNNDGGTVAFMGHVAGDPASIPGFPPQSEAIAALTNGYVKDGATGTITEFAHAGGPIPASAGGGVFRNILDPHINNAGDVIFKGDLTPAPDAQQFAGLFLYSKGVITAVARPGDAMPGDIVFNGTLDTDADGDLLPDQGTYRWSHGRVSVVARTGTVLPGVGTVRSFVPPSGTVIPPPPVFVPNSGAINNDRGQVFFSALLTNGDYVLLLATPEGPKRGVAGREPGPGAVDEPRTEGSVRPLIVGALHRANVAGVGTARPGALQEHIADLLDPLLGQALPGTIGLNQNAAGRGRSIGPAPANARDFLTAGNRGDDALAAAKPPPADVAKAVAAGDRDAGHMLNDPDLDALLWDFAGGPP
jgi:hypothetical protein